MAKLFSGETNNSVIESTLQDEGASGARTQTIVWYSNQGEVGQVLGDVPSNWTFASSNQVKQIQIGTSCNVIGNSAFTDCNLAETLTISNGVTVIGDNSFKSCTSISGSLLLPERLRSIGNSAFSGVGFDNELSFPDTITNIGFDAFRSCSSLIGSLRFPDSVKYIGSGAFKGCTSLNGSLTISNNLSTIEDDTFDACNNIIGDLLIPDTIFNIGNNAFRDCHNLNGKLTLSNNLTSIGNTAFLNNYNLKGPVNLADSIESIGSGTFSRCWSLSSNITFPNNPNFTSIEQATFSECYNIYDNLIIPDTVVSIGLQAFRDTHNINGGIVLGNNLTSIDEYAFQLMIGIVGDVTIPSNVSTIGNYAFWHMGNDQFVSGSPYAPPINNNFYNWAVYKSAAEAGYTAADLEGINSGLGNALTISESVTSIGDYAFASIQGFDHINCYASKNVIDSSNNCFFNAGSTYLIINALGSDNSWTATGPNIEEYDPNVHGTFSQWVSLNHTPTSVGGRNNVLVQKTLSNLTPTLLYSDRNFRMLELTSDIPANWNKDNVREATRVIIGTSCTSIGASAFSGCTKLTGSLTIPSSVASIGDNAFAGCTGLTSVWIDCPKSVIPPDCFTNCSNIKYVYVKGAPNTPSGWSTGVQEVGGITVDVIDNWL